MKNKSKVILLLSSCLLAGCSSSSSSDSYSMPSFFPSSSDSSSSTSSESSSSQSSSSSSHYGPDVETLAEALENFDRDNLGFAIESPKIQAKLETNGILNSKTLYSYEFDTLEFLSNDIKDNKKRKSYFAIDDYQIFKQTLIGENETKGPKLPTFTNGLKGQKQSGSLYADINGAYYDLSDAPYFYKKLTSSDEDAPEKGYVKSSDDTEEILDTIGLLPILISGSGESISDEITNIQSDEDSTIQVSFENKDGDFYLNVSLTEPVDVKMFLKDLTETAFETIGEDSIAVDLGLIGLDDIELEKENVMEWIEDSSNDITVNSFNIGLGYGLYDISYVDFDIDVDFSQSEDLKKAFSLDYSISKFVMDLRLDIMGDDEVQVPELDLSSYSEVS